VTNTREMLEMEKQKALEVLSTELEQQRLQTLQHAEKHLTEQLTDLQGHMAVR
jgi:hypothetical protein